MKVRYYLKYRAFSQQSSNNQKKFKYNIVAKTSRTLGVLSRVLKMADTLTRQLACSTLVQSILEFRRQVWDSYLNKVIKQLEKV